MRRIMIAGGALGAALLLTAPVFADDAGNNAAPNGNKLTIEPQKAPAGGSTQSGGQGDAGTANDADVGTAQLAGTKPSVDDVLSAMKGNAAAVSTMKSMSAVSKVHVVRIKQLPSAGNTPSLESAIDANTSEIDNLQSAIGANETLSQALEKENVDLSSVVATRIGDDGSLTVYVN